MMAEQTTGSSSAVAGFNRDAVSNGRDCSETAASTVSGGRNSKR